MGRRKRSSGYRMSMNWISGRLSTNIHWGSYLGQTLTGQMAMARFNAIEGKYSAICGVDMLAGHEDRFLLEQIIVL